MQGIINIGLILASDGTKHFKDSHYQLGKKSY